MVSSRFSSYGKPRTEDEDEDETNNYGGSDERAEGFDHASSVEPYGDQARDNEADNRIFARSSLALCANEIARNHTHEVTCRIIRMVRRLPKMMITELRARTSQKAAKPAARVTITLRGSVKCRARYRARPSSPGNSEELGEKRFTARPIPIEIGSSNRS